MDTMLLSLILIHSAAAGVVFQCDFEDLTSFHGGNYCGFIQPEQELPNYQWTNGFKTSSAGTGPSTDHTPGDDTSFFGYMEASSREPGSYAELQLRLTAETPVYCLNLFYHMLGADMGRLEVISDGTVIWSQDGDQGDVWLEANVDVYPVPSTLLIRGVRGGLSTANFYGDIAIDDVTLLDTFCDGTLPGELTTVPAVLPTTEDDTRPESTVDADAVPSTLHGATDGVTTVETIADSTLPFEQTTVNTSLRTMTPTMSLSTGPTSSPTTASVTSPTTTLITSRTATTQPKATPVINHLRFVAANDSAKENNTAVITAAALLGTTSLGTIIGIATRRMLLRRRKAAADVTLERQPACSDP